MVSDRHQHFPVEVGKPQESLWAAAGLSSLFFHQSLEGVDHVKPLDLKKQRAFKVAQEELCDGPSLNITTCPCTAAPVTERAGQRTWASRQIQQS